MFHFRIDMPLYLMALYGSVMILVVLLLKALFKGRLPKFVFPILWGLVLLRLLLPYSISSPLSAPVPEWDMADSAEVVQDPVAVPGTANTPALNTEYKTASFASDAVESSAVYDALPAVSWPTVLLAVFCVGMATTAAILLSQKFRYARTLRNSLLIEHNETINTILRTQNMGHVLVFTNDHIASPLVSGIFHPRIYLPSGMDFQNVKQLSCILAHEATHIKRKDNLTKTVMLFAICLHWYNPLVWVMSKCVSSDIEAACDAAVLKNGDSELRQNYAGSLLAMAVTGSRKTLLYSAFSKTEVERRIRSILDYKKTTALVLALSIVLMLGSTVAFATGGQAPFSDYFSSYCGSSNSRWAARAVLARDIAPGDNAQKRADDVILDVLRDDGTNDPDIIRQEITAGLAREFGVEKGAFRVQVSFSPDDKTLAAEYASRGITKDSDGWYRCNGEPVRSFEDKMPGVVQTRETGITDITVVRDRMGAILSVTSLHKGDAAFDERTKEIERNRWGWTAEGSYDVAAEQAVVAND